MPKPATSTTGCATSPAWPEPPDFISILDADFVPMPQFLRRALSLFREDDVGIVQTPQHFINPDPLQTNLSMARVWPDEQRYFFDVVMASKDAWGASFCCGTSSVIRFPVLQRIGGFPTDSVTEDYLVTLKMKAAGFRTVYLNERLSLGLAPEGLKEYVTQRSRWALGFAQICRGPLGPLRRHNGLTLIDRISLIETFLYWSANYSFRLLGIIVPILYWLFNVHAVQADVAQTLAYYLPHFMAQITIMGWMAQGRVMPVMSDVTQLLAASQIVKAVAHGLLKPKGHKFRVTAKGGDRSRRLVQWPLLRVFLVYLALTVAGVVWAFVLEDGNKLRDSSALCLFWSWYNILVLTHRLHGVRGAAALARLRAAAHGRRRHRARRQGRVRLSHPRYLAWRCAARRHGAGETRDHRHRRAREPSSAGKDRTRSRQRVRDPLRRGRQRACRSHPAHLLGALLGHRAAHRAGTRGRRRAGTRHALRSQPEITAAMA